MTLEITLSAADWFALFFHFISLSLLAVGGALTIAPDMHRYLVGEQGWLTDAQFNTSIALAQAAPGPNVLFIALIGWNVGLNAAGGLQAGHWAWVSALCGVAVTMVGVLIPSTLLTYNITRWAQRNRELRAVRAFKVGMAPIVIALLIATGWLLSSTYNVLERDWPLWLLSACSALLVWRTKVHMLWLLGAGAAAGLLGLV